MHVILSERREHEISRLCNSDHVEQRVHFVMMLLKMFNNHNLKSEKTFTSDARTSLELNLDSSEGP